MKLYLSVLVLFVFVAIAFVFGTQNDQIIQLNYIIAKSRMSVAMAVSLFTLIGFIIGVLTMFSVMLSRKIKRMRKTNNAQRQ
ncbi:LapA family protein [Thalassotalea ponticola]|uniref:LapA family protein n=1 Tax=Thalassotalea ponticola TaxID=1523392 RepID=UPI0025B548D8|nr:LapA family protein [Thalassotalea ponticola]MDN3652708.1 LapA family protein [Thalassotalea ponticola]